MTLLLMDNQDGKDVLKISYIDIKNPSTRQQLIKMKKQIDFLLDDNEE